MSFRLNLTTIEQHEDPEVAVHQALHAAQKNHLLPRCNPISNKIKETKPKSRGRRIRFIEGHKCQTFQCYTQEEIPDVWYQCDDYNEMKQAFAFTLFMMDAGCPSKVENDEHTTRGLERRTEDGQWKRYQRKCDYYNAVLDEQDRQWENNEDDQQRIAEVAMECSIEASMEAFDYGVKDEQAIYGDSLISAACQELAEEEGSCDDTVTTCTLSRNSSSSSCNEGGGWVSYGDYTDSDDIPL